MRSYILSCAFVSALSCGAAAPAFASADTWEVLLKDIPVRIAAADAGLNMSFYVLKQTHEPVLRTDDGENYRSKILKAWSRDVFSRNFRLCPDTGLEFEPGSPFTFDFFFSHISSVTAALTPDFRASRDGDCVSVAFRTPMPRYLDFLTLYEYAPSVKKDSTMEAGLGEFLPVSVEPEKILLNRKRRVSRGYNSVVIHKYLGPSDPNLENRAIRDFNRMQISTIPEWVKREYAYFDSTILQTVVLVINYPDRDVRKAVYNCMDADSLRRALYPTWKEFVDIQNLLPIGVPGALPGKPRQECRAASFKKPARPLVFINFGVNNDAQMAAFMKDFERRTGIKVEIRRIGDKEIQRALYQYPRKYDLVIVSMGAVRPDHTAFFDYMAREDGYFDFRVGRLPELYKKLLLEGVPDRRDELGGKMAAALSSEFVVLPLLQVHRRFYYPRNIRNLTVGRGFLEYPEVADFKW